MKNIPFYRHDLGELEMTKVREVLAQPILTTGDYVVEVEQKLEKMLSIQHALCVTSCTGGLHLALMGLGIGPGDEVITTPMSFIATATAILEAGATPIFVDVEPETGNIDPSAVEAAITPRTSAIMPVHLYGLMCDMRRLREIADRHGLAIIEDAAHCVEGERDGIRPGALSNCAIFSFYATKNLTCGEGGAIVTSDTALKDRLTLLRLHGMTKTAADRAREGYTHWDMVLMGWKYNMSNIEAAFLLPQFDRGNSSFINPECLFRAYDKGFSFIEVPIPFIPRTDGEAKGTRIKSILRSMGDIFLNWLRWGWKIRFFKHDRNQKHRQIYRVAEPFYLSDDVLRLIVTLFRDYR